MERTLNSRAIIFTWCKCRRGTQFGHLFPKHWYHWRFCCFANRKNCGVKTYFVVNPLDILPRNIV